MDIGDVEDVLIDAEVVEVVLILGKVGFGSELSIGEPRFGIPHSDVVGVRSFVPLEDFYAKAD